jgi:hypothetical protein
VVRRAPIMLSTRSVSSSAVASAHDHRRVIHRGRNGRQAAAELAIFVPAPAVHGQAVLRDGASVRTRTGADSRRSHFSREHVVRRGTGTMLCDRFTPSWPLPFAGRARTMQDPNRAAQLRNTERRSSVRAVRCPAPFGSSRSSAVCALRQYALLGSMRSSAVCALKLSYFTTAPYSRSNSRRTDR